MLEQSALLDEIRDLLLNSSFTQQLSASRNIVSRTLFQHKPRYSK